MYSIEKVISKVDPSSAQLKLANSTSRQKVIVEASAPVSTATIPKPPKKRPYSSVEFMDSAISTIESKQQCRMVERDEYLKLLNSTNDLSENLTPSLLNSISFSEIATNLPSGTRSTFNPYRSQQQLDLSNNHANLNEALNKQRHQNGKENDEKFMKLDKKEVKHMPSTRNSPSVPKLVVLMRIIVGLQKRFENKDK